MWTFLRNARAVIGTLMIAGAGICGPAWSQAVEGGYPYTYGYHNQTYTSGLYLPQVPQPNGQDEIRAADGTTCRASMASNDAYLDVGGIGGQAIDGTFNQGSVYGRIIVPLGAVTKRLDCTALYDLEIARLRHELELVRSGMPTAVARGGRNWAEEGWSDSRQQGGSPPPPPRELSALASKDGVVPQHVRGPREASADGDVGLLPWTAEARR